MKRQALFISLCAIAAGLAKGELDGERNIQLGAYIGGQSPIAATNNVAVGSYALYGNLGTTPHYGNVVIGVSAGAYAEGLHQNVFIGAGAGNGANFASNCVAIGVNAGEEWSDSGRVAVGDRIDLGESLGVLDTGMLAVGRVNPGAEAIHIIDPDTDWIGGVPWTPGGVRTGFLVLEESATNAAAGRRTATLTVNGDGRLAVMQNGVVSEVATGADADIETAWRTAHEDVDYGDTVLIYADGSRVVTNVAAITDHSLPMQGLVAVYGGTNCTEIGDWAFVLNHSNTSLSGAVPVVAAAFPSVRRIGHKAFLLCYRLKHLWLPEAEEVGRGLGGVDATDYDVFSNCLSLEEVDLPSATNITYGAFYNCVSLRRVYAPAANAVGGGAFQYCGNLEKVDFGSTLAAMPVLVGTSAFSNIPRGCRVIVPDGLEESWRGDNKWEYAVTNYGVRIVSQSGAKPAIVADVTKRLGAVSLAIEGDGSLGIYTNGVLAGTLSLTQGE